MSYECCKRIILNEKNNVIKVCIASNNVAPKTYETCEFCKGNDYSFDEKLLNLYYDLQSGVIQVSTINDNTEKFEYALCKVREYLKENNIDSYEDLYCKRRKVFADFMSAEIGFDYNNWKQYREWKEKQDKSYVKSLEGKCSQNALKSVYGKSFEIFKKALYENISGGYFLKLYNSYYISKLGKYNRGYERFCYNSFSKLIMSYKKAYIVKSDFSNYNMEIIKV